MTPWAILLDCFPILAMALAIVLIPLLAEGPARRRETREKLPSLHHIPASENASARTHMQMAIADVHLAKVR